MRGRFIEFGRIRAGVGSFFWGKPHLKTEQKKTLHPGGILEEILSLKFDALHLQLLLKQKLTATGKTYD